MNNQLEVSLSQVVFCAIYFPVSPSCIYIYLIVIKHFIYILSFFRGGGGGGGSLFLLLHILW